MAYTTNRFCWHGLMTTDPDKAASFYTEAIGWKTQTIQMGDAPATMFSASDTPLAHYMKVPMEGVPTHWSNYLRVDDVDATTKTAVANGGSVVSPPTDIPPGRFSVISTPSGAPFCIFHEADEGTAVHHPGGIGSVHWTELHSKDIDKDVAFLKSTFGFSVSEMPMPKGTYYMLNRADGQPSGGAMAAMMEQAPSMWLTWFSVDNCDAALTRIQNHSGKVLSAAMDMPGVGRMAVVQDNTGGVFGVIQPEAKS